MAGKLKEHPKVLALLAVSVLVLGVGLAYTYWPTAMPDMPESLEDVSGLLDSKAYANLTREQRRPYVQRVSELMQSADQEQRRAVMQGSDQSRHAMREGMRQMMLDRAKAFAIADAATKRQMIAEDRARFEAMGGRGGPGGGPPGGGEGRGGERSGDRGDRPEPTDEERAERRARHESRIEQMINEGNGQERALIREYMMHVRPPRD
ncbi:MAG: hypothetical protein AAF085_00040 [Planctomycetota bacterium]